jgi:hypothetical protein
MKIKFTVVMALALFSSFVFAAKPLPMITIVGDKFVADGKEFKIWGFNSGGGLHLSDVLLKQEADRLAFLGVNMMRLHSLDWTIYTGDTNAADDENASMGLKPTGYDIKSTRGIINADNFYRLLNSLGEKKIYVAITLDVCSHFGPDDVKILKTTPEDEKAWVAANEKLRTSGPDFQLYKTLPSIDDRSLLLQKEWATNLLSLRNPKTGVKLAEDPQLALLNTVNENSCWGTFFRNKFYKGLPPYFMNKFVAKWNQYLKGKYGTDSKLVAAWKQADVNGLLPGESVEKGTVKALPIDAYACDANELREKCYSFFSEARRRDFVRFLFELDAARQRAMRDHFRSLGWTRPSIFSDNAMGIGYENGPLWMASDLMPYVEEHPYDEAFYDVVRAEKVRICTYCGSNFLGPNGADRPIWGSEFREGMGAMSWTRIPMVMYAAMYHSLQGRDGLTWHVWDMMRTRRIQNPLQIIEGSGFHCDYDFPWQFSFRAAGRLFRSCEIKPLAKGNTYLTTFLDWQGNIINSQVYRQHGDDATAILKISTEHFRTVVSPIARAVDFSDVVVNLTSNQINTIYVEKLSNDSYEVTAIGTTGSLVEGQNNMFNPTLFVTGDVTFKGRTIEKIEHIDYLGRVIETIPGKGAAMPFADGIRLYRVYLKK